jgi:hypothetical protein
VLGFFQFGRTAAPVVLQLGQRSPVPVELVAERSVVSGEMPVVKALLKLRAFLVFFRPWPGAPDALGLLRCYRLADLMRIVILSSSHS